MTGCKGEECPFYVEFWSDVDKIGAACSHPDFHEMKHSIKGGLCPFMDDVAEHQQKCKVKGCKEPAKDSRGYCQNHLGGYDHMMEPVFKYQQKREVE